MATRIIPLDLSNEDVLQEFETQQHAFWRGNCISFAAAVHRITGWEVIAIDTDQYQFSHCGVRSPEGVIWDGRGPVTAELFIEGHVSTVPEAFRVPAWDELKTVWPAVDLPGTERIVSQMFPHLPHLPSSDRSRNLTFMDRVEALSRRCNVWIRGAHAPHMRPVIGEAFGEEVGYRAAKTDGRITMDRMLRSDVVRGPSHLSQPFDRFLGELANLSHQHGLWIRAGLPTTWPRIVRLDPERINANTHYVMRQTDNAAGFLITLP